MDNGYLLELLHRVRDDRPRVNQGGRLDEELPVLARHAGVLGTLRSKPIIHPQGIFRLEVHDIDALGLSERNPRLPLHGGLEVTPWPDGLVVDREPDRIKKIVLRKLGSEPKETVEALELDQDPGGSLRRNPGVVEERLRNPLRAGVHGDVLRLEKVHDPLDAAVVAGLEVLNDRGGVGRHTNTQKILNRSNLVVPGAVGVPSIASGLPTAPLLGAINLDNAGHLVISLDGIGWVRAVPRTQRTRRAPRRDIPFKSEAL